VASASATSSGVSSGSPKAGSWRSLRHEVQGQRNARVLAVRWSVQIENVENSMPNQACGYQTQAASTQTLEGSCPMDMGHGLDIG
jgi:hypothetical protein